MNTLERLGVVPTDDPLVWRLTVGPRNISGLRTLFGGAGIAAAVGAAETTSGRPLVWCTAQFLSQAHPDEIVTVEVDLRAEGRAMTQANIRAHVDGRVVLEVMAALGQRDFEAAHVWAEMPDVPSPEATEAQPNRSEFETISSNWDRRIALGRQFDQPIVRDDGRSALWVRPNHDGQVDAALLSILGDYIPFGVHQFLEGNLTMSSLDNTIRIVELKDCEWILVDVRVQSVLNGIGQGHLHLWTPDGTLLATASQSCQIRRVRTS